MKKIPKAVWIVGGVVAGLFVLRNVAVTSVRVRLFNRANASSDPEFVRQAITAFETMSPPDHQSAEVLKVHLAAIEKKKV